MESSRAWRGSTTSFQVSTEASTDWTTNSLAARWASTDWTTNFQASTGA